MKTLVTGGAGFIGSHLVDALTALGQEVLVVDNLSTGSEANLSDALAGGARLEVADVVDRASMLELSAEFRPELVVHLAGQIDVRVSVENPAHDATINIAGTANMLEGARRSGARRFLFASTGGAIYGEGDGRDLPLDEEAAALPVCPYGQSKLAAEGYLELFRRLYGLDTAALRFGNVYGPRQDPHGEAGVIAIFCGKLQNGERPVVYGSGRQTRDYIYVADVVDAIIAAAASVGPGTFNIGTGQETALLDLVDALGSFAGRESFEPVMEAVREGEVERISIDPGRATEVLGWKPTTDLAQGLRLTFESLGQRNR